MLQRIQSSLKRNKLPGLLAFITFLLMLALVSACGNNGTTVGSQPSSTPTPTPPLKTQNCGAVHAIRMLVVPTDQSSAKQNEECFAQAYQQCHPATLIYTQSSLDTGTIHNLSIKNVNGKCTIQDGVQTFIVPKKPGAATNYTCSSLEMKNDGLHISSCGSLGDVFIPLASAQ